VFDVVGEQEAFEDGFDDAFLVVGEPVSTIAGIPQV
jgi:hypothetical protein